MHDMPAPRSFYAPRPPFDESSTLEGAIDFAEYRNYGGSTSSSTEAWGTDDPFSYSVGHAFETSTPSYSTVTTPSSAYSATFTLPAQQPQQPPTPVSRQQQVHGGVRPSTFTCTLCGWSAETGEQYDYHLRAHDGDCLFQCFLGGCEEAFAHAEELVAHSEVHRLANPGSSATKRSWAGDDETVQYIEMALPSSWTSQSQRNKRACVEPATPTSPSGSFRRGHRKRPSTADAVPTADDLAGAPAVTFRRSSVPPEFPYEDASTGLRGTFEQWEPYASVESLVPVSRFQTPPPAPPTTPPRVLPTFTIPASPAVSQHATPRQLQAARTEPALSQFAYRPLSRLASPVNLPFTAPIPQGQFQPYPELGMLQSAEMAFSSSLPHPATVGRPAPSLVGSDEPRRTQPVFALPATESLTASPSRIQYASPRHLEAQRGYTLPHPPSSTSTGYAAQLQSPVSPAATLPVSPYATYAVETPVVYSGSSPRRRSSGGSSAGYSSARAALVSAASMNRLLACLPEGPPSTPYIVDPSEPAVSAIHPRYRIPPPTSLPAAHLDRLSGETDGPPRLAKTHVCEIEGCGKAFKRLEHLKRHERTHTDDKPFCCDVPGCGRWFSRSDNLAQHRRTHDRNGKNTRKLERAAAAKLAAETAAQHAAVRPRRGAGGGEEVRMVGGF